MSASRTRELTGEVDDAAVWDAAGVKERDHRTTPPMESVQFSFPHSTHLTTSDGAYLYARLNSGRA